MKAALLDLLGDAPDAVQGRSTAREYLQARILLALQDHGAFTDWAFLGGTALRFLYRLPRYSEDLDFSLVTAGGDGRFEALMRSARHDLAAEAYEVEVKVRTRSAVAVGLVKFRGLLHEARLSPHAGEVLAIRVEVDTNPPAGAQTETRLLRRFGMLNLLYHDRASLFAGKLHAVLTRGLYERARPVRPRLVPVRSHLAGPEPRFAQQRAAPDEVGRSGGNAGNVAGTHRRQARIRRLAGRAAGCNAVPRAPQ